jgi:glycyl-tRNA synthetase beta chain
VATPPADIGFWPLPPSTVTGIEGYSESGLAERFVIVDPVERKAKVVEEVKRAVSMGAGDIGAQPVLHEGLLDTVTNLVEYPYGICGHFDRNSCNCLRKPW